MIFSCLSNSIMGPRGTTSFILSPDSYPNRTAVIVDYSRNAEIAECAENVALDKPSPLENFDRTTARVPAPTIHPQLPRIARPSLTYNDTLGRVVHAVTFGGRMYAFKYPNEFPNSVQNALDSSADLLNELDVLLRGQSPLLATPTHIVIDSLDGQDFFRGFLMPYYSQGTLSAYMRRTPSIPFDLRLRWINDIARALHSLHIVGIFSGDVKLDNVCLTDNLEVRLIDFAPSAFGTLTYSPPELTLNYDNVPDLARDSYATGIVMWAVWHMVDPSLLQENNYQWADDAPGWYQALSERCMSLDPAARPTMLEISKTIEMEVQSGLS
ncbi:kinase-like protein [Hymenopellis radicata]|nr:kinase-like protein [Hymenopellis radicata]